MHQYQYFMNIKYAICKLSYSFILYYIFININHGDPEW